MPLNRILLVEDDADVRAVCALVLEATGGFVVESCASADAALDAAQRFVPDLILLDVVMEGMGGVEALAALRERPATRRTPVVFLTARVQPDDVAGYGRLGCLGVIPKPFEPSRLADTLRALWERRRA